jgi:hypothetical protein
VRKQLSEGRRIAARCRKLNEPVETLLQPILLVIEKLSHWVFSLDTAKALGKLQDYRDAARLKLFCVCR